MAEYTFAVAAAPVPYRQPPANNRGSFIFPHRHKPLLNHSPSEWFSVCKNSPEILRFQDFVGIPTVRGYNAPCFEGMVHYFMGFALMHRDNGDRKDKIRLLYCSIPRYPCFSAFPSKYRKANAGIRSKSLPPFVL